MFDRCTDRARKVLSLANKEALQFHHDYIGTEHILLGLMVEGSGVAANVLENLDIDLESARYEVSCLVKSSSEPPLPPDTQLPFNPRAKRAMEFAIDEAHLFGHNYVGTEHLLLGLVRENDGLGAKVLTNLGLQLDAVRREVLEFLGVKDEPPDVASNSKAYFFEMKFKEAQHKLDQLYQNSAIDRKILTLRYDDAKPVEEIAKELNLSAAEVERRIAEAKEQLMKHLFGKNSEK